MSQSRSPHKVVLSCAVTGSIHTPSMSPYLPVTPDEIARESIAAAEAGAAVLHLHARNPGDGSPSPDPAIFMEFLPRIREACDAIVNITTGGGHQPSGPRIFECSTVSTAVIGTDAGTPIRPGILDQHRHTGQRLPVRVLACCGQRGRRLHSREWCASSRHDRAAIGAVR